MQIKNKSTNRSFGIVFFIVFLLVAFYPFFKNEDIRVWSLFIAIIFLILGLLNSKILTPLNSIWFRFGLLLGKIVSPVIMGIIFFIIVTPIAFFMRILGNDLLNLKYNNNKSYWIKKSGPKSLMKNQF
jgi:predicted membrane metal-binding protein|tara:strand:+ start:95 stop:478 length:384 start_codon:yes stop_codon:yes gene_type:complete